jgi:resolvase-like protein
MIYGYARVSTDGQSVEAQVRQLTRAGCKKVFREVASGAQTDRAQLRRLLDTLAPGDVVTVTRLDRLARSTRDLLNTLATITAKQAGFRRGRPLVQNPPRNRIADGLSGARRGLTHPQILSVGFLETRAMTPIRPDYNTSSVTPSLTFSVTLFVL